MQEFIGKPLHEVLEALKNNSKKVTLQNNNFNVVGDTKLVTNIFETKDEIIVTFGEFIFNLKG